MKLDVELISEMVIFGAPSGAGRVRSGAGITLLGVAGDVLEEFEDGDPTHTQNLESRSHRPRAWCVCVCVCVCV